MEIKESLKSLQNQRMNEQKIEQNVHWQEIRERAAIAAMQAYICAPIIPGVDPNPPREEIVEHFLAIADELIKQLKNKAI